MAQLDPDDFSAHKPRFVKGKITQDLRVVYEFTAVAMQIAATPAQVALAWLLAQGHDIVPIPGAKRVSHLEEDAAADNLDLRDDQLARLGAIPRPIGARYADMATVNR